MEEEEEGVVENETRSVAGLHHRDEEEFNNGIFSNKGAAAGSATTS